MKKVILICIKEYQKFSPYKKYTHCRYIPTCSQYAIEAVEKYGAAKGSYLAIKRIIRCNPFSKGGIDPVP